MESGAEDTKLSILFNMFLQMSCKISSRCFWHDPIKMFNVEKGRERTAAENESLYGMQYSCGEEELLMHSLAKVSSALLNL